MQVDCTESEESFPEISICDQRKLNALKVKNI
jgi:hypothetical protein